MLGAELREDGERGGEECEQGVRAAGVFFWLEFECAEEGACDPPGAWPTPHDLWSRLLMHAGRV